MEYEDNDAELVITNPALYEINSELLKRHDKIVRETTKRLFILVCLVVVFLLTFLPNFITTVLKNTLNTQLVSLKPYNLISSIVNMSNSTLNATILLFLCLKSNDTDYTLYYEDFDHSGLNFKNRLSKTWQTFFGVKIVQKQNQPVLNGSVTTNNNECVKAEKKSKSVPITKLKDTNIHKANNANRTNLKEFYSKIGTRLGTSD